MTADFEAMLTLADVATGRATSTQRFAGAFREGMASKGKGATTEQAVPEAPQSPVDASASPGLPAHRLLWRRLYRPRRSPAARFLLRYLALSYVTNRPIHRQGQPASPSRRRLMPDCPRGAWVLTAIRRSGV